MKRFIIVFVIILFFIGWLLSQKQEGVEVGNIAPDFITMDLNGETVALSELAGKRVVLYFWVTWCGSCRSGMEYKQVFYESFQEQGIEIITVNLTKQERSSQHVMDYVKEEDYTFPVWLDEQGDIGKLYEIYGPPTTYLINTKGVIEEKIVGLLHHTLLEEIILNLD